MKNGADVSLLRAHAFADCDTAIVPNLELQSAVLIKLV